MRKRTNPPVETSKGNTQIKSFSFQIKAVHKLKLAVAALCDSNFNRRGFGMINVEEKMFQLTVINVKTRVNGHLRLLANDLNKFCCSKPFNPKMIDLKSVLSVLDFAADHDTVTITHLHGSTQLSFTLESVPNKEFPVDLIEPDFDFGTYPAFTSACETVLQSQHLREMIPLLIQEGIPQKVFVQITHKNVTTNVGYKNWNHKVSKRNRKKQLSPCEEHYVLFDWPHSDSLMIASRLQRWFSFTFGPSDAPVSTLMLSFLVTQGCKLAFVRYNSCFKQNYSFEFMVKMAPPLKCALQSLTDFNFCPRNGFALIEVNDQGCEITVQNYRTGVSGILQFKACDLIRFLFNKPLERKMVNLKHIALSVLQADDDDYVAVYQIDGSNEISFESTKHCFIPFASELRELDAEFKEVQLNFDNECGVRIPSEDLRQVIPLLVENGTPQTVSLEIKDSSATISIEQRESVSFYDEELLCQSHHVSFNWPHSKSLKWASESSEEFELHLQDNPTYSIILQFELEEPDWQIGTLMYSKGVHRLMQK